MKLQRIPAQITTVEDKITGNLNLTQITLLILPIFVFVIVYALFIPSMHFALYKVPLFLISGSLFPILAIRFKEKLILQWLVILFQYNMRPKYYLFNKNDLYQRTVDLPTVEKKQKQQKVHVLTKKQVISRTISFGDLVRLEGLLTNPKYSFSIKSQKKGAFSIAFEQKQK
jgi:hypothetical protein